MQDEAPAWLLFIVAAVVFFGSIAIISYYFGDALLSY
jgi:hypothetical protein